MAGCMHLGGLPSLVVLLFAVKGASFTSLAALPFLPLVAAQVERTCISRPTAQTYRNYANRRNILLDDGE